MASEEERAAAIAVIIDALEELGERNPGSTLRAEDWNALVDAVSRVARLPPIGGGTAVASGELPPGSVGFEELGVDVQLLLRSGPYADPRQLTGQRDVEKRLGALSDRLAALEARLDALLTTSHRAETDLSRHGNDLRLVDQRVAGALGMKGEVADLRTLLGSVRTDVADVLELRDDIGDIDLVGLRTAVTGLEGFRDSWRDGDGSPVTFLSFNRRLAELGDRAITDEELTQILDDRFRDVVIDTGPIETSVTNLLRGEVLAARDELRADQERRFTEALRELRENLDAEVSRAIGASLGDMENQLSELAFKITERRLEELRPELREEMIKIVEERLNDRDHKLRVEGLLGEARPDGEKPAVDEQALRDLEARLQARVDELGHEATAAAASPLAALSRRVDELAERATAVQRGQAEVAAALRRERAEAVAREGRRLEALIEQRAAREGIERAGAVDAASGRVASDARAELAETARVLRAERDAAVASAVEASTNAIGSRLEARVRVVAADAVAAVEADVSALQSRVRTLDRSTGQNRDARQEPDAGDTR